MNTTEILISGTTVIVGTAGSGKTEVSVNLALYLSKKEKDICVVDLDLVNPYFRSREARSILESNNIKMILPPDKLLSADLPILSPKVAGAIKGNDGITLIDAGGDGIGSVVLAALGDVTRKHPVSVLHVVNPNRPFTTTVSDCLKIQNEIETCSKLPVSGIIGNANLMGETKCDDIVRGYEFIVDLSEKSGIPISFITVQDKCLSELDMDSITCPILPIYRQMVPPWIKAENVN